MSDSGSGPIPSGTAAQVTGTAAHVVPGHYVTADDGLEASQDHHGSGHVAHQFDDAAQQKEAATLGMWAFLATEVMFFGGVLLAYAIYRSSYSEAFAAASQLEDWKIGGFNTLVLLCSSLTVVLAVYSAHHGNSRAVVKWILVTIVFGLAFLGVKAYEYNHLYHEHLIPGRNFDAPHVSEGGASHRHFEDPQIRRGAEIFFSLYFCATGIHALHMIVGIGIMLVIAWMAHRGRFTPDYYNPVEISGLYWHFVDIVWIFLYPLLYLIDPLF